MRDAAAERFWSKVNKDGPVPAHVPDIGPCWLWTAGKTDPGPLGYGQFHADGRDIKAHRFAWILAHGPIPEGMLVCHKCDTPTCVRAAHLFLGTPADNRVDAMLKDRLPRTAPPAIVATLTPVGVEAIRQAAATGARYTDIARQVGVSSSVASRVARGLSHRPRRSECPYGHPLDRRDPRRGWRYCGTCLKARADARTPEQRRLERVRDGFGRRGADVGAAA